MEGPDWGEGCLINHDSRVDFFVHHDSQKINCHDHGSRKLKKKKSVEKRITIANITKNDITHQTPHYAPWESHP